MSEGRSTLARSSVLAKRDRLCRASQECRRGVFAGEGTRESDCDHRRRIQLLEKVQPR